jgi:hypothetical protein
MIKFIKLDKEILRVYIKWLESMNFGSKENKWIKLEI